jgi:hypothetical protein
MPEVGTMDTGGDPRRVQTVAYVLLRLLLALTAPPWRDYRESEFLWIEVPDHAVGRSPA